MDSQRSWLELSRCGTERATKMLAKLISFLKITSDHRQFCHVGNKARECKVGLFQVALFGYMTDSKSTSGGLPCIFGDHTCCANDMGMQGTDSTTEAEVTSLITGQMMEGWIL